MVGGNPSWSLDLDTLSPLPTKTWYLLSVMGPRYPNPPSPPDMGTLYPTTPLLLASCSHHSRPVQTCSLDDPPPSALPSSGGHRNAQWAIVALLYFGTGAQEVVRERWEATVWEILRFSYSKRASTLWQHCDDARHHVLIESNGVTRKRVVTPLCNNSIVFNESSIASVIAALTLTLSVNVTSLWTVSFASFYMESSVYAVFTVFGRFHTRLVERAPPQPGPPSGSPWRSSGATRVTSCCPTARRRRSCQPRWIFRVESRVL